MTRDPKKQGIPDRQNPRSPTSAGGEVNLSGRPASHSRRPADHIPVPPPPPPGNGGSPRDVPQRQSIPVQLANGRTSPQKNRPRRRVQPHPLQKRGTDPAPNRPSKPRWRFKWLSSWKFWLVATALISTSSGALALAVLLRLPGLPNCPAIFWPLASASLRFECARIAASKQTIKDLLEAIDLVDSLPTDHPLRTQADELVEVWSQEVLNLAEERFNAGDLPEAIAAARRIPTKVSAYKLVEERIQQWQAIWSKAEKIYQQAEDSLRKLDWRQAFSLAVRLLDVENTYWQTTKYQELSNRITTAREDGSKLGRARRLADDGGLTNLLEALKLAESINEKSYVYQAAQKEIGTIGRKMLDLAQYTLDKRDLQAALSIVSKIPESAKLQEETKDFTILATAQSQVWSNTVSGLEEAISQAQRIGPNRPLRNKAQGLIARWQLEIAAIAQLEKARVLAQPGTIEDLKLAIAEAYKISQANPRWSEVQQQISTWSTEVQTIEDRPILDQAEQIAIQGDVASLQAAVTQAEQIGRGRALSKEAQAKVRDWNSQIQRIQDQPYLDRARELASAGDLTSAIAAIEQIKSGRSLYDEAQAEAKRWRDQIQAEELQAQALRNLQEARRLANSGSADGLVRAIDMAAQISGSLKSEANDAIEEWSWQLLQAAKSQAVYDVRGAILSAQKIPSRATSYNEAQQDIQAWKKQLGQ